MTHSPAARGQRAVRIALLAALLGVLAPTTWAQRGGQQPTESFLRQQRSVDRSLHRERGQIAPFDSLLDWEWGGWVDYYVFSFDDGIQSSRVYQHPTTAFWTRLGIDDGAHTFFARVRLSYSYFNPGDEYDRQQDWVGPNFDRAWYELDLARALHLTDTSGPYNLRARIGRQEVRFGTGFVLDMPLDSVVLEAKLRDLRLTGLVGRTPGSTPNVDRSPAVDSHSDRRFLGLQATYDGLKDHQPFAYALWQNDHTDERPRDPFQEYTYETSYFGAGSQGSLVHNLNYWVEAAYEYGLSYGDGMIWRRDRVSSWGLDAGLEYLWDSAYRPRVAFEYMFGSGDGDRLFSPTSAVGGNRGDCHDSSFVAFGYRDTGLSLAPGISNLHIWRLGGSFTPAPTVDWLRDLELGSNWFLYHKHQSRGAISDQTADEFSGYVGWEMDYFVNWRFASDLSWTARWGVFFPGSAFSDRDERQFFLTGITWSY